MLSESKEQTQKNSCGRQNNLCLEKELFVFANFGFVSERKEEVNLKTDSEVKKTFSGLFFLPREVFVDLFFSVPED